MKINKDLQSKAVIYLKAILFCLVLVLAGYINLETEGLYKRAGSLVIVIWCSARIYYFMFYVIEHYVDSTYKFSGLTSLLRYHFRNSKNHSEAPRKVSDKQAR